MIAIIASMYNELSYIIERMDDVQRHDGIFPHFTGRYRGKDLVLGVCRTGKVHAALTAQYLIDTYHADFIFNIGTSGALADVLNIGDVVVGEDCIQHDMDVSAFGYEVGLVPDIDVKRFCCDQTLLSHLKTLSFSGFSVYFGTILSGDCVVGDSARKEFLISNFNGMVTEMEGAAVAQVAYVNQLPFMVIRGASDKANEEAAGDFTANIRLASDNAAFVTLKAVESI